MPYALSARAQDDVSRIVWMLTEQGCTSDL